MNKQRTITGLAAVAVLALVAGAVFVGLNLGAKNTPLRLGYPTHLQSVADGCRPVAPGSYSTICQARQVTRAPSGGEIVCKPVAPGAYSQICYRTGTLDEPAPPAPTQAPTIVCRPVAPGAFTEICERR